jgi:hypothetical protein
MRASLMPAASMALADGVDVGAVGKLHLHLGAAAKVHAQGTGLPMCDQFQLILTMPATLKIMEKARKYHFHPSQFTLRRERIPLFFSF